MNLFKTTAALMLVAALAGCGPTVFPNELHQNEVYGASAAYGATLQTAIKAYGHLPYCAKGTTTTLTNYCQDPVVEVKLADANAKVAIARKAIENFTRNPANYPGLTYSGLLGAYQLAQTTLSQIAATSGVH